MKTIQWLVATAALSLSLPVFATPTPTTYNFTTSTPALVSGTYNPYSTTALNNGGIASQNIATEYGNQLKFGSASGAAGSVSVSAFASTGQTSGTVGGVTFGGDTNARIETGIVTYYSGNGLAITSANGTTNAYGTSTGTNAEFKASANSSCVTTGKGSGTGCVDVVPDHAMDNMGAYEALLLAFDSKVKLNSITIGFPTNSSNPDSDATVLYYTGSGIPPAVTNSSFASLLTSGWAVANGTTGAANGNSTDTLYNLGTATGNTGYIANPVAAQYFLIGAYIPLNGETNNPDGIGASPDYIKLKGLSTTKVPEPTSLALFGIAGGALFIRRRRSARAV